MLRDFSIFLWLLKLGALANLWFLASSFAAPASAVDPQLLVPARILWAVSAFRCLFPNQYKGNVVFHDTPLSSIFLTRLLATFAEVGFIYLLARVLRLLNVDRIGWVDALSWYMVAQVVLSQFFVWGAILTGRLALYFWEELGWAVLIAANAAASVALWPGRAALGDAGIFLAINLLFAVVYLVVAGAQPETPDRGREASRRDAAPGERRGAGFARACGDRSTSGTRRPMRPRGEASSCSSGWRDTSRRCSRCGRTRSSRCSRASRALPATPACSPARPWRG